MNFNISDIPAGAWTFFTAALGLLILFFNRKKTDAEINNIIGKSYSELLEAYKEERLILSKEMETLRKGQTEYLSNANELLRSNRNLTVEIDKLKKDHNECSNKNEKLHEELKDIRTKLNKNGIG